MYDQKRINSQMSSTDCLRAIARGHNGRINGLTMDVLAQLNQQAVAVDPELPAAPYRYLREVDKLGLYGGDPAILLDVCEDRVDLMAAVLRAHMNGYVTGLDVREAVLSRASIGLHVLPLEDIVRRVQSEVPGFARMAPTLDGERVGRLRTDPTKPGF